MSTGKKETVWSSKSPPQNYEEFAEWIPYITHTAQKYGVPTQYLDDFVGKYVLRFYERQSLEKYDPISGKFAAFLWGSVERYTRSEKRAIAQEASRTCYISDQAYETDGFVLESIEDGDFESDVKIAQYLKKLQRRSKVFDIAVHKGREHVQRLADLHIIAHETVSDDVIVEIEVSLYTLAQFLLHGISVLDIAFIFNCSRTKAVLYVELLRIDRLTLRTVLGVVDRDLEAEVSPQKIIDQSADDRADSLVTKSYVTAYKRQRKCMDRSQVQFTEERLACV